MDVLRRFEAASGLGATLLGLLVLAYVVFGPLYSFVSSSGQTGTASLFQVGIQQVTLVFFALVVLALIGVALGAIAHGRTGEKRWRSLLWISTALLGAFMLLALLSVGVFFLPSVLCALLASILSTQPARDELH